MCPRRRPPDAAISLASALVLVVEDFDDAREMYAEYLRYRGFTVAEASDGVEAVRKCEALKPAIVLMDMALPILDGWEATRRLKANPGTSDIPIIALSGHALPDHERRAKEAGCDGFVKKPCLPGELYDAIARILSSRPPPRAMS